MSRKSKLPSAFNTLSHNPCTKELALANLPKLRSAFEKLANCFALNGINLRRSDWRKGQVRYFAHKGDQAPKHCSLSDLGLILRTIGGLHA